MFENFVLLLFYGGTYGLRDISKKSRNRELPATITMNQKKIICMGIGLCIAIIVLSIIATPVHATPILSTAELPPSLSIGSGMLGLWVPTMATPIPRVKRDTEGPGKEYLPRVQNGQTVLCGKITCSKGFEVQPCTENFTNDGCSSCPPGTQMLDITTSEIRVRHCTEIPSCDGWPNTVYSADPYYCTELPLQCKCDTEKGYCGADPCQCDVEVCQDDEVLQQNCSCVKRPLDPELPPGSVPTTKEEVPMATKPVVDHVTDADTDSDLQTQHPDILIATSKLADTTESPLIRIATTTPAIRMQTVPGFTPTQDDRFSPKTFGAAVGTFIGLALVVALVAWIVYTNRREYSAVPTNDGNPPGCIHILRKPFTCQDQ